jgi:hypothetical protein
LLTNRVNNTEAKLTFERQVIGQEEFVDFRILSEHNFYDVEILGVRTGEAASTLNLEVARSSRLAELVRKSFEMAFRPSLFFDMSRRVSTSLCSVH